MRLDAEREKEFPVTQLHLPRTQPSKRQPEPIERLSCPAPRDASPARLSPVFLASRGLSGACCVQLEQEGPALGPVLHAFAALQKFLQIFLNRYFIIGSLPLRSFPRLWMVGFVKDNFVSVPGDQLRGAAASTQVDVLASVLWRTQGTHGLAIVLLLWALRKLCVHTFACRRKWFSASSCQCT